MPTDKDAREKYNLTMKEFKEREFAKCIEKEDNTVAIKLSDIVVEDGYTGPRLNSMEELTHDWVIKMMEYLRDQKVLHKKYAVMIILRCKEIFEKD